MAAKQRYWRVQRVILLGFAIVLILVAAMTVVGVVEYMRVQSSVDEYANWVATQVDDGGRGAAVSDKLTTMTILMAVFASAVFIVGAFAEWRISRGIGLMVRAASSKIGRSATQLLAVSSQVAAGAAQTAVATNETTATVEEVRQTAQVVSEKAAEVAGNSQTVARTADTGRATVEETISGIERMQDEMAMVAETISRLSEHSQAVGDIIAAVSDLAEQSNLLSVNASIEASKAGDQGKGFTVVAQEVKSLAEQSKQAVAQVHTILSEIQRAGEVAVRAVDRSQETIEAGRRQSVDSGETINALAESVNDAARSAQQIAASSRQQLAGMEQISRAIENINEAGAQSVSGTRQVEEEVRRLQDLALGLRRLVDREAAPPAERAARLAPNAT